MTDFLGIEIVDDANNDGIFGNNINEFHPHNDVEYWTGNEKINTFPEKSPVGDIFISEYDQFHEICLFELNGGELDGKSIKDTNGSGNKGILIGDYSTEKKDIGVPAIRDSYVKIPKVGRKDGAF